jgi:ATP-dependent DNA ligase
MSRVVKRSAPQGDKSDAPGAARRQNISPLPAFIPPQLSQPVAKPPSGAQWLHEIKLDGYRMAARIDNGRAQLLTRTGLDWTDKYPSAIAALADLNVKTAYIDGELCGVDESGLPSFAHTQVATDGESGETAGLLRVRSLAPRWPRRLEATTHRAQNAPRAAHRGQARPSIQWT